MNLVSLTVSKNSRTGFEDCKDDKNIAFTFTEKIKRKSYTFSSSVHQKRSGEALL